jgi:DnaK suppressor protein
MTHTQTVIGVTEIERELERELRAVVIRLGHATSIAAAAHNGEATAPLGGDLVEDAQVVEAHEVRHLNQDRLARRAKSLMLALQRVKAGTYGICDDCGEAIPPARLRALPSATTCVVCQQLLEDGTRYRGR